MRIGRLVCGLVVGCVVSGVAAQAQGVVRFSCGGGAAGGVALTSATVYTESSGTESSGAGFDLATVPTSFEGGACSSEKPFFFSVKVPDGNYEVRLVLGGAADSTVTVKAESRRLMVNQMAVAAKGSKEVVFNVNVRTETIYTAGKPGEKVKLKAREVGALDWDDKLTLEFNGVRPSVRAISVKRAEKVPTVYLAGDSTVVDQDKEPWAAWGQMLPVFFGPGVSIANEAESGETIRSFTGERRLAKILSTMVAGDYLMIQFAHNDQKPGSGYVPAMTDYKDYLRKYIAAAREKGATPILVTSMNRRSFDADGKIKQTLGEYPQAMREVGAEQKVAVIDLNAMSKTLFEAMGDAGTLHAFVHYPANTFPEQTTELKDDTHFNAYGAYELACAVVEDMRAQKLALAGYLRPGVPVFDPAKPMAFAQWTLPASPSVSVATPYGR